MSMSTSSYSSSGGPVKTLKDITEDTLLDVRQQFEKEKEDRPMKEQQENGTFVQNFELLERNAIMENDKVMSRISAHRSDVTNAESDGMQEQAQRRLQSQLSNVLIEKLRLEEIIEFMRDEHGRFVQQSVETKARMDMIETDSFEKSNLLREAQIQLQTCMASTKRIEDQLNHANINFVTAQKKIKTLEKETKEQIERLSAIEADKKMVSAKWAAASSKLKGEERLRERVRELEIELASRDAECEDFKRKYVNSHTELRVFKESEGNYKEMLETKLAQLRSRWSDESKELEDLREFKEESLKQRDELIKQNTHLLEQLEEFTMELRALQERVELTREANEELNEKNEQLEEEYSRLTKESDKLKSDIANSSVSEQKNVENIAIERLGREELTKRLVQANAQIQRDQASIRGLSEKNQQQARELLDASMRNNQLCGEVDAMLQAEKNEHLARMQHFIRDGSYVKLIEKVREVCQNEIRVASVVVYEGVKAAIDRFLEETARLNNGFKKEPAVTSGEITEIIPTSIGGRHSPTAIPVTAAATDSNVPKQLYDRLLVKYFSLQNKQSQHASTKNSCSRSQERRGSSGIRDESMVTSQTLQARKSIVSFATATSVPFSSMVDTIPRQMIEGRRNQQHTTDLAPKTMHTLLRGDLTQLRQLDQHLELPSSLCSTIKHSSLSQPSTISSKPPTATQQIPVKQQFQNNENITAAVTTTTASSSLHYRDSRSKENASSSSNNQQLRRTQQLNSSFESKATSNIDSRIRAENAKYNSLTLNRRRSSNSLDASTSYADLTRKKTQYHSSSSQSNNNSNYSSMRSSNLPLYEKNSEAV